MLLCNLPQDTRNHEDSYGRVMVQNAQTVISNALILLQWEITLVKYWLGILGVLLGPTPFALIATNIGETQNTP